MSLIFTKPENISFPMGLIKKIGSLTLTVIFTGAKVTDVEQMVENHLETLIIKHFDPKKADSIFSAEGEVRKKLAVEYLFDALHGRKIQNS